MTPLNKLALYCDFVVLKHTVFAIPFAYLGVVLASILLLDELPGLRVLFLVTTAFFGARSGAMSLNNLVDADIDKKKQAHSHAATSCRINLKRRGVHHYRNLLLCLFSFSLHVK